MKWQNLKSGDLMIMRRPEDRGPTGYRVWLVLAFSPYEIQPQMGELVVLRSDSTIDTLSFCIASEMEFANVDLEVYRQGDLIWKAVRR